MVFPFKIPIEAVQRFRRRIFYTRAVWWYRYIVRNNITHARHGRHKYAKWFIVLTLLKLFQKGARARKEDEMMDYNLRRANIRAAERALWDEELALHSVNVAEAEAAVHRQRLVDYNFRMKPVEHGLLMGLLAAPLHVKDGTAGAGAGAGVGVFEASSMDKIVSVKHTSGSGRVEFVDKAGKKYVPRME